MKCISCESTSKDKDFIFETRFWKVFLASEQSYLGRSFVVLKRHCGSLSELNKEE